jgi:hypothetical protein
LLSDVSLRSTTASPSPKCSCTRRSGGPSRARD